MTTLASAGDRLARWSIVLGALVTGACHASAASTGWSAAPTELPPEGGTPTRAAPAAPPVARASSRTGRIVVVAPDARVVPLSTFGAPLGDIDWFVASTDGARTFSEPVSAAVNRGAAVRDDTTGGVRVEPP